MNQKNDLKNILNNTLTDDIKPPLKNENSTIENKKLNIGDNYIENMMILLNTDKMHSNKNWSKLDKNIKLKLLNNYIDIYSKKNNLNNESKKQLKNILTKALYSNLLNKQSDIIYNKETETIENITCLVFNEEKNIYEINIKEKGTKVTNKSKSNVTRLINSKKNSKSKNKTKN